jgi:hypothetical protein
MMWPAWEALMGLVFCVSCVYAGITVFVFGFFWIISSFCVIKGGLVYEGMSRGSRIEKGVGMKGL